MSRAATVEEYLAGLPAERRAVVSAVRDVVLRHLPRGFEETMNWGMICYEVPLRRYPDTYNKQPLCQAGLATQKNHYALYLMSVYQDPKTAAWFEGEVRKAGKRLDMGKACVRFQRVEDLPLDAIGTLIGRTSLERAIALYEKSRHYRPKRGGPAKKGPARVRPARKEPAGARAKRARAT